MSIAFIWPPLKTERTDEIGALVGYFSWFFGHLFEEIVLPISKEIDVTSIRIPEFVSFAALVDAHKINFISDEQDIEKKIDNSNYILLTEIDAKPHEKIKNAKKMLGSITSEEFVSDVRDSKQYYYIGDPGANKQDAYYATCFTYWYYGGEDKELIKSSRDEIIRLKDDAKNFEGVSVFGTGPSVVEAIYADHSAQLAIICNTIVKNRNFWKNLNLRVIVAADAHFHFSYHRYSSRLLSDIFECVTDSGASFFTFDKFAVFLRKRIPWAKESIFGIPAGRKEYGYDLDNDFRVFPGESVVNMFLLPIAMFLSDDISLNGFTGRAPSDQFFWNHSDLHQYTDLMEDVRCAHKAFFENRDYPGYADAVGTQLEARILKGREGGKSIKSKTKSFYPCLK